MPSVSSMQRYFPLDDDCEAALLLLQLTVACALRDAPSDEVDEVVREHREVFDRLGTHVDGDTCLASLRDRSGLWREELLAWAGTRPEDAPCDDWLHRLVVILELCTSSVFLDQERLHAAAAVRRTDFLLDVLEVDGWCGDVRLRYVDAVQILAGEQRKAWLPKAAGRARKVVDLFARVEPGLGVAAAVLDWVDDEPAVAMPVAATPVLARVLALCLLAPPEHRDALASTAAVVLLRDIDKMSRRVEALQRGAAPMQGSHALSELQSVQCSQARALQFLGSLTAHGLALDAEHVPSLVGHRLPEARSVLAHASGGRTVDVVPASGGRAARGWGAERHCRVVGQQRLDEGGVRLVVDKAET